MSQMVGVQATANVLAGERYKNISKEVKAYCKGEYGKAPGKIDPEVMKKALGDEQPIKGRYADTLEPVFEKTKAELKGIAKSDEDVLDYVLFPQVAEKYFAARKAKEEKVVRCARRKRKKWCATPSHPQTKEALWVKLPFSTRSSSRR